MMRIALSVAVAFGAVAASGCGTSTGTVSGLVTLDGKPVERATVSFLSANGNIVSAMTGADGKYTVAVPSGSTQVTVTQLEGGANAESGESIKKTGAGQRPPSQPTTVKNKLPTKYATFDSSGLKVDVKGDTAFDIPLTK